MASSKNKEQDVQVTFYDVANRTTQSERASAIVSKYSTKETVNLCIREKKGMSYELFFLILAVILVFLLIVEFFGIYRPYLAIEKAEAELADRQAYLEQLYAGLSDREEVRAEFRKYYYEDYPSNIVDRDTVLDLLAKTIFGKGKITEFGFSGNNLTLRITDVSTADLANIPVEIYESGLCADVPNVSRANVDPTDEEKTSFLITIEFKDAREVA